jgi:hypothetical protein
MTERTRDFVVLDTDAAAHALWIFGLRRDQIAGVAASELRPRIRDHRAS